MSAFAKKPPVGAGGFLMLRINIPSVVFSEVISVCSPWVGSGNNGYSGRHNRLARGADL